MSTCEITIERKTEEGWLVGVERTSPGNVMRRRAERVLAFGLETERALLTTAVDPRQILFRDAVRHTFAGACAEPAGHDRLRVRVTVEDEGLRPLRWERLCAPLDAGWNLLALNQDVSFSFYQPSVTDRRFPRWEVTKCTPDGITKRITGAAVGGGLGYSGDFGLNAWLMSLTLTSTLLVALSFFPVGGLVGFGLGLWLFRRDPARRAAGTVLIGAIAGSVAHWLYLTFVFSASTSLSLGEVAAGGLLGVGIGLGVGFSQGRSALVGLLLGGPSGLGFQTTAVRPSPSQPAWRSRKDTWT